MPNPNQTQRTVQVHIGSRNVKLAAVAVAAAMIMLCVRGTTNQHWSQPLAGIVIDAKESQRKDFYCCCCCMFFAFSFYSICLCIASVSLTTPFTGLSVWGSEDSKRQPFFFWLLAWDLFPFFSSVYVRLGPASVVLSALLLFSSPMSVCRPLPAWLLPVVGIVYSSLFCGGYYILSDCLLLLRKKDPGKKGSGIVVLSCGVVVVGRLQRGGSVCDGWSCQFVVYRSLCPLLTGCCIKPSFSHFFPPLRTFSYYCCRFKLEERWSMSLVRAML